VSTARKPLSRPYPLFVRYPTPNSSARLKYYLAARSPAMSAPRFDTARAVLRKSLINACLDGDAAAVSRLLAPGEADPDLNLSGTDFQVRAVQRRS